MSLPQVVAVERRVENRLLCQISRFRARSDPRAPCLSRGAWILQPRFIESKKCESGAWNCEAVTAQDEAGFLRSRVPDMPCSAWIAQPRFIESKKCESGAWN